MVKRLTHGHILLRKQIEKITKPLQGRCIRWFSSVIPHFSVNINLPISNTMIDRRHQVFVSSTYVDLVEERSEVMQALLELECMPAGMELFPAATDSQWDWIKRVIDESDYYIVIIGGRYGSVSKETGQSYTEMEYRYAIDTGKPIIGFLHEDPTSIPAKFVEQQTQKVKKLESFRELVQSRLCKFYDSPTDLGAKVSRSITQLKKQHPRSGWIRADILEGLASSDDVLHLRKENDDLRAKIAQYGLEAPRSLENLSSGNDPVELAYVCNREVINADTGRYKKHGEETGKVSLTWDQIFKKLGPELLASNSRYWDASRGVAQLLELAALPKLKKKHIGCRFTSFKVFSHTLDTVLLQLRALKLIELDEDKDWQLTPYGDNYLTSLLGVKKGEARPDA
jgi:hypothetical protein